MKRFSLLSILFTLTLIGCSGESSPGDPFAPVFEAFGIVLVATLIGRFIAKN